MITKALSCFCYLLLTIKANKGRLRENEARRLFQQLIHAVDYIHSCGVCHRDLKVYVLINFFTDTEEAIKLDTRTSLFLWCSQKMCCWMVRQTSKSPILDSVLFLYRYVVSITFLVIFNPTGHWRIYSKFLVCRIMMIMACFILHAEPQIMLPQRFMW